MEKCILLCSYCFVPEICMIKSHACMPMSVFSWIEVVRADMHARTHDAARPASCNYSGKRGRRAVPVRVLWQLTRRHYEERDHPGRWLSQPSDAPRAGRAGQLPRRGGRAHAHQCGEAVVTSRAHVFSSVRASRDVIFLLHCRRCLS